MNDQSRVALASLLGATVGGVLGYLYLTESGERLRADIEPTLDSLLVEIRRIRTTVEKARVVADEGWRTLNEVTGQPSVRAWR